MSEIIAIFVAIIGVLLGMLGFQRNKNAKQKQTIKDQETQIKREQKQAEVYKINQELASELDKTVGQIEEEHKVVKQKIEEAGTHEEIIDIANDIISDFNGVSDHSSGKQ